MVAVILLVLSWRSFLMFSCISAASWFVRVPASSSIDRFFVRRFITCVKLSFGCFRAASLWYASSEIEMFLVPMFALCGYVCVCF